jgi:protease YdgD
LRGPFRGALIGAVAGGLIAAAGAGQGQAPDAPAPRTQALFHPGLSAICALGTRQGAGCDAIRAREILDAAARPWSAIGRVNFGGLSQRSHCTGTLIAADRVLTAAHCLYNAARKRWIPPESLRFVAGYQRGTGVGLAGVTRYILPPAHDPAGPVFDGAVATDWALLVLDTPLGEVAGTLPLAPPGAVGEISLAGYPGLRPHVLSRAGNCEIRRARQAGAEILTTPCAAMQGDSGAPLLIMTDTGPAVLGVLSAVTPQGPRALAVPVSTLPAVE